MYRSDVSPEDDRIRRAIAAIAERERLHELHNTLVDEIVASELEIAARAQALAKERASFERYADRTHGFFQGLFRDRAAAQLARKQRDVSEAVARHAEAEAACGALRARLAAIVVQLDELDGCVAELEAARAAKEARLVAESTPVAADLEAVTERLAELADELGGLEAAIAAGDAANAMLVKLLAALDYGISSATKPVSGQGSVRLHAVNLRIVDVRELLDQFESALVEVGVTTGFELAPIVPEGSVVDSLMTVVFREILRRKLVATRDGVENIRRSVSNLIFELAKRRMALSREVTAIEHARIDLLDPR